MISTLQDPFLKTPRLPLWFRQPLPDSVKIGAMKSILAVKRLHTVCEGAHCPNKNTCWQKGVATFLILGDTCTRSCRFCAVKTGELAAVDPEEPSAVAEAVKALGLRYVVITSVTRDDLSDQGALHFAQTVKAIRQMSPAIRIETLIPDFTGCQHRLALVVQSSPEVISHNLETVCRLTPEIRPQADYGRSLFVLRQLRQLGFKGFIKSGIMLGMGESGEDIYETFLDLRAAGCDILTIGQYLAPSHSPRHLPVDRFVSPEEFAKYEVLARDMGFASVKSGPLVRSSFMAEEGYDALT